MQFAMSRALVGLWKLSQQHSLRGTSGDRGRDAKEDCVVDVLQTNTKGGEEVRTAETTPQSIFCSACYASFYCVVSIAMVSVNKVVVSNFDFSFNFFLLLLQSIATIAIIRILGHSPKFDTKAAYKLIPLSLIYLANVHIGLVAVRLLSVPVYTVIKRLTPFPTMCLDYLVRSKTQPLTAVFGVILLIFGPLLLARGDLDFEPWGYAMGLTAVGVQALFLVAVSWTKDLGFSEIELSWYNSVLTLGPLTCGMLIFEADVVYHVAWSKPFFIISLVSFATLGSLLLFSMILVTSRCSGLTLTVVGQAKSLGQLYIGFFWFGKVRLLMEGFFGIGLSTLGALVYACAKLSAGSKGG